MLKSGLGSRAFCRRLFFWSGGFLETDFLLELRSLGPFNIECGRGGARISGHLKLSIVPAWAILS